MSGSHPIPIDPRLAEEAAQWLIELDEGTADLRQFAAWLKASPRHVEEFLLASAVWHASDALDSERQIDVAELLVRARDNVLPLDTSPSPSRYAFAERRASRLLKSIGAALAVAGVACLLWIGLGNREQQYATEIGEQRAVKLPDGSVVMLNTRSSVSVRFADTERVVELVAGEALFDVEQDASRPFRVVAGGAMVQAIGTQFNVRRAASSTTVSVVEGVVQISSVNSTQNLNNVPASRVEQLSAGQQAQVLPAGQLLRDPSVEIERVMAWRERRLIFRDEPLVQIAAEFNRYNDTQLIVEGSATRSRRMSGVFDADDPGALIAFLGGDPALSVASRDDTIVIRGP